MDSPRAMLIFIENKKPDMASTSANKGSVPFIVLSYRPLSSFLCVSDPISSSWITAFTYQFNRTVVMKIIFALISTLAMPLLAAPISNVSKVDERKSTIKVNWLVKSPATTTENAKADRGAKELPLSISNDCATRFKIEKLAYKVDAGDSERIMRSLSGTGSMSDLEVVMVKQFAGRGATPDMVLIMGNGKRYGLDLNSIVDVGAWPRKGYRIKGFFGADNFQRPDFWSGVEVRCH